MSIRDYLSQGLIDSAAAKAFMTEVSN
jgi:hypothetical protein